MEPENTETFCPPMDYETALERVGMDRAFLIELIDLFNREFPVSMLKIREALAGRDFASVRALAHSLKGSSASLSFHGLRQISHQLESAGEREDRQAAEKLLAVLQEEFRHVNKYLAEKRISA